MNDTLQSSPTRPLNWPALLDGGLLILLATLLLAKWSRGVLDFYIHPRYHWLVLASALVLAAIALVRLRAMLAPAEAFQGRGMLYLLLSVPLLLGVLVPARPLGADTLLLREGLNANAAARWSSQNIDGDPQEWNLLQWATALSVRGEDLSGAAVRVEGFVFPVEDGATDSFLVLRYVITCCAADGNAVGLPVHWPSGAALPTDSWVRVEGTLGELTINGQLQPAILASSVTPIEQPRSPYLFP